MKKTILFLSVTAALLSGVLLTGCQGSSQTKEGARDQAQDTKDQATQTTQGVNQSIKDSVEQFRKESGEKISANEQRIAEFKVKIAHESKATKARYEKILAGLEQQNRELKKNLEDFKEDGKEDWGSFKAKFNHDMDELGESLKGLTVKNK